MKHFGATIACIGTGPSLMPAQIASARAKGFTLFGCNNIHQIVPDLALLFATNVQWWDHYWCRDDGPREHPCEKWTNNREAADKYRLNYIDSRDAPGLSSDPKRLHHGHSSGYCLLNLAHLMGAQRIVLLGYDMKYSADYNGRNHDAGSGPRHYFGEYPSALLHWPKVSVTAGVLHGLVDLYRTVAAQGSVEIINCTPGSALDCFPMMDVNDVAMGTGRQLAG